MDKAICLEASSGNSQGSGQVKSEVSTGLAHILQIEGLAAFKACSVELSAVTTFGPLSLMI